MPNQTATCDMPIATCPHCEKTFQWDDYYDIAVGDDHLCPLCEKTIHVLEIDKIISARLGAEPRKE